ncbi:MAG: PEP-CTERM system TPR-repeat protein PrsT [Methylovulum sp.]|nr:PEP-CTERM system TPR-repeat protein PrsT [Methylovulum sp.]
MSMLTIHERKTIGNMKSPKFLYRSLIFALGMQACLNLADAAVFKDDGKTSDDFYLTKPNNESEPSKDSEGYLGINGLNQLLNGRNEKALLLTKQGYEKLKKGESKQGLKDLEEARKLDPELILTGVLISLAYLENKDFQKALDVAKEIQQTKRQADYGLGYTAEGMIYAAKGDVEKATSAFQEAIRLLPNEKNALFNLAILAEAEKNYNGAKSYLQRIIDLDPKHLQALERYARIEFTQGNTEKAIALLTQAAASNSGAISPVIALAKYYLKSEKYQDVLNLTQNKSDPEILEMRGKAYLNLGETEKAKQIFEDIVKKMPMSAPANYALADFFAKTGNLNEAAKQIHNTTIKDPSYLPARIGEIKTLFYSGKIDDANRARDSLQKEFGNRQEVLSISGWLSMHQNEFVEAATYFEQLAKINQNSEVTLWWVNSLWSQKRFDESISIMKNWLAQHPDDISVQLTLADGYMGLLNKPEAKNAYLKLISMDPSITAAYNNLAWLEAESDLDQAISYAEKAVSIEKTNPQVLDTLGMLLIKDGQIEKGTQALQDAVDKAPENIELLYHLSEALVMQNKQSEAASVLNKLATFELSPEMKERVSKLQELANKN